ncbi:MAG: response regulator transcription factor [Lachnospiraceae bacterium]|nr:response regulator transcription factor [Lachnospiraceae bacterium]MCM1241173.1 response regulator transcription factor [Lachnospiraceae bacterium]
MVNLYDCKILLVDDNRELLAMTEDILKRNGYDLVVTAESCREAEKKFAEERPHLVILDIMLPDGDGFTLFRTLREHSQVPILFLSARDEDNDRLFGLGLGADDYITKPFLPQELALRVSAVLKRSYFSHQGMEPEETLTLGRRKISLRSAVVEWEGQSVSLTAKELLLLQKLYRNRGNIVTFDALCRAAWNDDYYGYENVLMVHIRHLREKIEEDPSHPEYLLTARGLGYRLAAERKDGR